MKKEGRGMKYIEGMKAEGGRMKKNEGGGRKDEKK
jgi:hypothetical protein